jgi:hypothetical protein
MTYPPEHPTPLLTTKEIDARIADLRKFESTLVGNLYRGIVFDQIFDLLRVRDLAHDRDRLTCSQRGHALKWVGFNPVMSTDRPFLICDRCGKYARNMTDLYDPRFTYDPHTLAPQPKTCPRCGGDSGPKPGDFCTGCVPF